MEIKKLKAAVVKLVDTQVSEACGLKALEVRVLSAAQQVYAPRLAGWSNLPAGRQVLEGSSPSSPTQQ